jgi:two-component system NtrC family response regulator
MNKTPRKSVRPYEPGKRLMAWTPSGVLVLDHLVTRPTLALSGRPDSDVVVPALGGATVFARVQGDEAALLFHSADGHERKVAARVGELAALGELNWMLVSTETAMHDDAAALSQDAAVHAEFAGLVPGAKAANAAAAMPPDHGEYLRELIGWLARPMGQPQELRDALKEFLAITVRHTAARNGLLVLAQRGDHHYPQAGGGGRDYAYTLISAFGFDAGEVERLWDKMPASLPEEILRHKARILLPEELRQRVTSDSTVFIRGVRSLVGFPVLAEDRLVALFYVGFDNLLRQLSPELQSVLEAAADLLGIVVQRADLREQLESEKLLAAANAGEQGLPSGRLMVGGSQKLVDVYKAIARLSPVDVPALILGETGTGKELAAKEMHRLSPRAKKPFIVVNAAALPETLIESELFGHKKGSFTGALSDRIGLVEQAAGGTLFIDEIGELPLPMQSKLLRVLQERAVTRIGEATPRPVDFRLVCATHRDLETMVADGRYREDLYYRIAGATIRMPALRERPEDIVPLANYFRKLFAERHGLIEKEWSADALAALEDNAWPGNIRELENVVSRAFVMAEGPIIRRVDLGFGEAPGRQGATTETAAAAEGGPVQESLELARDSWMKSFLVRALKRHKGKRAETAKALGIGERTLFRYIEQFDIRDE